MVSISVKIEIIPVKMTVVVLKTTAEVKRKQTDSRNHEDDDDDNDFNDAEHRIEEPKLQELDFDEAFKFWNKKLRRMALNV